MVSSGVARSLKMMASQNSPEGGHQNTHDRGMLMASGSGRVRFGSVGSRDRVWGISEL